MAEENAKGQQGPGPTRVKKAYSKPSVVSEPIYETMALACGKLPGQGGTCGLVLKLS
jgi:hypothetical protein